MRSLHYHFFPSKPQIQIKIILITAVENEFGCLWPNGYGLVCVTRFDRLIWTQVDTLLVYGLLRSEFVTRFWWLSDLEV